MTRVATVRTRRPAFFSVIGELFITLGVITGMFLVWQLWINDWVSDAGQAATAQSYAERWAREPLSPPAATGTDVDPPVTAQPAPGAVFANLIVPRFGKGYIRPIAEGVGSDVLDDTARGMGHYPGTELPGAMGNIGLASHRTAYGGALHFLETLRLNDAIYLETREGWYEYRYRNTEYVLASGAGVLDDVPQHPSSQPGDRLLTLTTCNPLYSSAERIVAYAVFDSFHSRADGPPAQIAGLVKGES
jgi:sortase A